MVGLASVALNPPRRVIGALLRSPLSQALTAPHGVDRYLELLDPLGARDEMRARIVARRRETADCATLVLAPGRQWSPAQPGQHLQLGVELDGVRHIRCFSVAGERIIAGRRHIEITVKAQDAGRVSRWLVSWAAPGAVVTLSPAAGEFVLPATLPQRLLLVSGGSGITPVMAMLRALSARAGETPSRLPRDVVFLHYAQTRQRQIFAEELAALEAAHSWLRVVRVYTRDAAASGDGGRGLAGRFTPAHLHALGVAPVDYASYACGPAPLIAALQAHWAQCDAHEELAVEYFQPPAAPTGAQTGGRIRFANSDAEAIDDGKSLLEQAEAAGLNPAYGCRMGICRSCTCAMRSGRVRNLITGAVSSDEPQHIQPCVSVPVGDVTLAL